MKGTIDVEKTASGTSSVMDFCETIREPIITLIGTQELISLSSYDATILERSIALNQMACLYLKTITGSDKPEAEEVKLQAGVCFNRYLNYWPYYFMDTPDDYNIKAEPMPSTAHRSSFRRWNIPQLRPGSDLLLKEKSLPRRYNPQHIPSGCSPGSG